MSNETNTEQEDMATPAIDATDTVDTTEGEATTEPDTTGEEADEATDEPALKKVRREAAKYRNELKDTRTQLDQAHVQLENYQRQQVELALTNNPETDPRTTVHMSSAIPSVAWDLGHKPGDYFDTEGNLNSEKVSELHTQLKEKFPFKWGSAGQTSTATKQPSGGVGWGDALKRPR